MGNIAKIPLTALIYLSLSQLIISFFPFSETYLGAMGSFETPLAGYIALLLMGIVLSLTVVLFLANAEGKAGASLVFIGIPAILFSWVMPLFLAAINPPKPLGLQQSDYINIGFHGIITTLLLMVLWALLFRGAQADKPGAPKSGGEKYKIKVVPLLIKLVILPVIFVVLYFICWYFFAWRVPELSTFYGARLPERINFVNETVSEILRLGNQFLLILLKGLLYPLFSLILLQKLQPKRMLFLLLNTLLYASGAMLFLFPNPFLPDGVRMAHFLQNVVLLSAYGLLTAFMLHTTLSAQGVSAAKAVAAPAAGKAAAAAPAGAVAAAARK